jgi:hypothetical protein
VIPGGAFESWPVVACALPVAERAGGSLTEQPKTCLDERGTCIVVIWVVVGNNA